MSADAVRSTRHAAAARRPSSSLPLAFCGLVLAATAAVALPFAAMPEGSRLLNSLVPLLQWLPALTAFALYAYGRRRHGGTERLGDAFGVRPQSGPALAGWLGISVAIVLAIGFVQVGIASLLWIAPWAATHETFSLVGVVLPLMIATCLATAGEELAWRGWLTTTLEAWGFWSRTAVIAVVWVLWHVPLLAVHATQGAMTSREVVASLVNIAVASVLLSALRERSGSVWPAVLAHAAMNTVLVFMTSNLVIPAAQLPDLQFWAFQAIGWAAWLVAGAALAPKRWELRPYLPQPQPW